MDHIDANFITDHFIKYCRINSRSDEHSNTIPTTQGQIELAHQIEKDFNNIGIQKTQYNEQNGFLTVTLNANQTEARNVPAIGFIAHLDTADFNAQNVNPKIHPNYQGNQIVLNQEEQVILDPVQFPRLLKYEGQTLITTDGTTLLGTDDKAGIAASLTAAKYLVEHPDIPHGTIKFAFGPDEEIGRGAKCFDADGFDTQFAYTLDNGAPGELQNETFNAAAVKIHVKGIAVHPGEAYGLMVNAITIANQIIDQLPANEVPENSRGHEGFFLVTDFNATIDHADINIIIRDFDEDKYQAKIKLIQEIVSNLDQFQINLEIIPQYHNIKPALERHPEAIDIAKKAYKQVGLTPQLMSFRGGTDGDFITEKGIPTPNLFNGGGNYHGPYEYESVEDLIRLTQVIVQISYDQFQNNIK